ncbi:Zn-dependent protease [Halohasta litchfieldiae]|jgi:Zn-dependent protease/CBS domain-containing protein|uniref:Zinc metalloprotease n=1 Tax=Halohasta litchfieldiae TaxID=1073996 RepID=A0A1H6YFW3_9EURY|nr:M50 family metallopeptidase [Halohasta litchfieldiae]ATW90105.1 Zn-dependent protease [Halohasta litchfieldiae]SEJ37897.1 Zn-dependent protease (includes SpoIVFB) [Halohasta litchfieldiae]
MRGIRLGSAFGIPIQLNWTFLFILPIFAWIIGSDIVQLTELVNNVLGGSISTEPLTAGSMPWILGFAAAGGLFFGVLLHEFGHSLVAMRYGLEIESITLWLLGGVASFKEIPEDWHKEFNIAIAGPVVSVLVGVVSFIAFMLTPANLSAVQFVLGYLAVMNIGLAIFNMLPGFPMDGGRVLRALLARKRPHAQATQMAAEVGKIFAFMLGLLGLFAFSPLFILLAFFIYIAASGEAQQSTVKAAFEGITVRDIMTPGAELHVIEEEATIAELLNRMFTERHTGYPVVDSRGDLVGMVTLDDARTIKEVERDAYRVEEVMERDVQGIGPDVDAITALRTMQEHDVGRLPVIDEQGNLTGIISRTDLMTAFNVIQSRGDNSSIIQSGGSTSDLPPVQ